MYKALLKNRAGANHAGEYKNGKCRCHAASRHWAHHNLSGAAKHDPDTGRPGAIFLAEYWRIRPGEGLTSLDGKMLPKIHG